MPTNEELEARIANLEVVARIMLDTIRTLTRAIETVNGTVDITNHRINHHLEHDHGY